MSHLRLQLLPNCDEPFVEFYVDGENLGTLVKASLGPGSEDVLPLHGGDFSFEDTVLGESVRRNGAESAILFACGCGYSACGSVHAKVIVDGNRLSITEISTWNYGGSCALIEPFVFDRDEYEAAVLQLEADLKSWRPRSSKSQ